MTIWLLIWATNSTFLAHVDSSHTYPLTFIPHTFVEHLLPHTMLDTVPQADLGELISCSGPQITTYPYVTCYCWGTVMPSDCHLPSDSHSLGQWALWGT